MKQMEYEAMDVTIIVSMYVDLEVRALYTTF